MRGVCDYKSGPVTRFKKYINVRKFARKKGIGFIRSNLYAPDTAGTLIRVLSDNFADQERVAYLQVTWYVTLKGPMLG